MIMNLGLPYKGSKNTIANDIVKALPRGKKLLDACCGGGAILMAAAMSGRWEKVVGNDLNAATIALLDAVLIHKGQIEYEHPPVCTRDDFFHSLQRIENGDFTIQDCVNKYCASFGNNGQGYLWNPEIEKIKVNVEQMLVATRLPERRRAFRKFIAYLEKQAEFDIAKLENIQQLQNLERLQRLERLERLERLDIFSIDYSEFDVVYFDIPYKGTAEYDFDFDYDRFYRMFATLEKPAFLSEYNSSYTCVSAFNKRALLCKASRKNGKKEKLEKLYFNGTLDDYKRLMGAEYRPLDEGKQIDIFEGVA